MKKTITILLLGVLLFASACKKDTNGNTTTVTVIPLPPTSLTATHIPSVKVKVKVKWVDNSTTETGFKIERKAIGTIYSVVGSVDSNVTEFVDSVLVPNITYTYRVYAFNNAGNSVTYSNEVEFTSMGYNWAELGGDNSLNLLGNNYTANTFASDKFGNIYVFCQVSTTALSYIAKFDKTLNTWSKLTDFISPLIASNGYYWANGYVRDSLGNIYISGYNNLGGNENVIAKWDGVNWTRLGGFNINSEQPLILYMDITGTLYAYFTNSSTSKQYVSKYNPNTNSWNKLGGANLPNRIGSICGDASGNIYLSESNIIRKWNSNSSTWSSSSILQSAEGIKKIAVDKFSNVYAIINPTGSTINNVTKLDNTLSNWSIIGGSTSANLRNSTYFQIESNIIIDNDGNIFVGCNNQTFNNNSQYGNSYVAKWSSNTNLWSELGGTNSLYLHDWIKSILIDNIGNAYASGLCKNLSGNVLVSYLQK